MKNATRIYNRFTFWSSADCDCVYCRFYGGPKRGCRLDECCCDDVRQEALRREQAANTGRTVREAASCRV